MKNARRGEMRTRKAIFLITMARIAICGVAFLTADIASAQSMYYGAQPVFSVPGPDSFHQNLRQDLMNGRQGISEQWRNIQNASPDPQPGTTAVGTSPQRRRTVDMMIDSQRRTLEVQQGLEYSRMRMEARKEYLRQTGRTFYLSNPPPSGTDARDAWEECKRVYERTRP